MSLLRGLPVAARCRVIVDNDWTGDPDGLVALAHHLLSPGNRVAAVTSSMINPIFDPPPTAAADGAALARELVDLVGGARPPVHAGSETPFGDGGAASAASDAIVAEGRRDDPLPLYLVCAGPLTNVADALRQDPGIAERLILVLDRRGPLGGHVRVQPRHRHRGGRVRARSPAAGDLAVPAGDLSALRLLGGRARARPRRQRAARRLAVETVHVAPAARLRRSSETSGRSATARRVLVTALGSESSTFTTSPPSDDRGRARGLHRRRRPADRRRPAGEAAAARETSRARGMSSPTKCAEAPFNTVRPRRTCSGLRRDGRLASVVVPVVHEDDGLVDPRLRQQARPAPPRTPRPRRGRPCPRARTAGSP